jgi:hypothetical protein
MIKGGSIMHSPDEEPDIDVSETEILSNSEYRESFLDSLERGISDAECGRTYSTEEVRALLTSRRKNGIILYGITADS